MNKHGFLNVCLAALVASSFSGCSDDLDLPHPDVPSNALEVRLFNSIEQVATSRVNDEGFCDGDGVGIYVVNYNGDQPGSLATSGNQADNVKYVFNEDAGTWTPQQSVFFLDKKTHVDIFGYYPYSTPTSIENYNFEVAKDQSTDAANGALGGYEASDFLWAKAENIVPTDQRIALTFRHRMAGVMVTLVEGTGFDEGEFDKLEQSVLVTNTIRRASIDLTTGTVTAVGDVPTTGTVPYKRDSEFRAVVVPQTVAAATPLFSLTVDGMPYVFRKDVPFTYIGGKLHKFSIQISKKTGSGLEFKLIGESITAWESDNVSHDANAREYIVVHCAEPGKLKEAIIAAGKDITQVKNLKITGTVNIIDFYMMRDEMPKLQSINMKEVTIAEGKWGNVFGNANEIPLRAFHEKSTLVRFVFPDNITKICGWTFYNTNISGSLIIPNGVKEISEYAFNGCRSLTGTISLPKSLEAIGQSAFGNCSGLIGELSIPSSVKIIGSSAFYTCSGLTGQLSLPENLEYLGATAFYSCSGFTGDLVIPSKITKLEENIFGSCTGLNGTLKLHNGILEIAEDAFCRCNFRGPLVLPDNLLVIGPRAFYDNQFTGNLILPSTLVSIGKEAFYSCSRLSGVIEFPEDIISISASAFANCRQLECIVLSKNVESIREGAFENCFQLNSIVCNAQYPPQLSSSAFNGVAKDNFTIEVPETSVADYSTAPNWNEFKRFAAHRDFSISRNLFRSLNASASKNLVLRAPSGASWSIESKPDWVTVTPSSGVGKAEVTITTNAMAKGAGNREGEVVFLLDGKDYRSRTKVEQYDYAYGDGDVMNIQTAKVGAGVDLVFMGDCFDAKDIAEGKYLDGINEAIGYFFAVEPYKSYRDYFNVNIVFGMSPDSGMGSVNTIREARFGSAYSLGHISPDQATCFEYACKVPTVNEGKLGQTLITLIENTEDYGGITYMYGDGSAIACCPMSRDIYPYDFRGIVQHEAGGHGFGKLGDEYIYHNEFIQTCTCQDGCGHVDEFLAGKAHGWYRNLSLSGNMHNVDWSHLIFDPQYSNVVDIYEGGYFHMRGVFRSEPNSCMNNNIPYFSAISRETIVKYIKQYAGETYSFEDFKSRDVATAGPVGIAARGDVPSFFSPGSRQHAPVFMGERRPKLKKR